MTITQLINSNPKELNNKLLEKLIKTLMKKDDLSSVEESALEAALVERASRLENFAVPPAILKGRVMAERLSAAIDDSNKAVWDLIQSEEALDEWQKWERKDAERLPGNLTELPDEKLYVLECSAEMVAARYEKLSLLHEESARLAKIAATKGRRVVKLQGDIEAYSLEFDEKYGVSVNPKRAHERLEDEASEHGFVRLAKALNV